MENINIIKTNSQGQIVISSDIRENLMEGKEFIIVNDDKSFILKADILTEKMKEDLEFSRRTKEAWKAYERGEFISQPVDEFLADLERC